MHINLCVSVCTRFRQINTTGGFKIRGLQITSFCLLLCFQYMWHRRKNVIREGFFLVTKSLRTHSLLSQWHWLSLAHLLAFTSTPFWISPSWFSGFPVKTETTEWWMVSNRHTCDWTSWRESKRTLYLFFIEHHGESSVWRGDGSERFHTHRPQTAS